MYVLVRKEKRMNRVVECAIIPGTHTHARRLLENHSINDRMKVND